MEVTIQHNTFKLIQTIYPWTQRGHIFVRGYAFCEEQTFLREDAFADFFVSVNTPDSFKDTLQKLDGFFSVIIALPDMLLVAVDQMRSMPLFYECKEDGGWLISDRISVAEMKESTIDADALYQFDHSIFTFGNTTLRRGCHQLQAGEYAVLTGTVDTAFWFEFSYSQKLVSDPAQAMAMIDRAFETSFMHTVQVLNGRTAVIPLSGGHDSRLVAYFLKKLGYEKVIAYSYGKKGYYEIQRAHEVAQFLDIPFYEINFPRKEVFELYKRGVLPEFLSYAGNGVSVPCIQEVYPVYYLIENGIIPPDSVFIPGHSTDFLSGSTVQDYCLADNTVFSKEKVIEDAMKRHCREGEHGDHFHEFKADYEKVKNCLFSLDYLNSYQKELSPFTAAEMYERIELIERESKYIENAVRVYEFFGHEWLTPEFDMCQYHCWLQISPILRYQRDILYQYEHNYYPKGLDQIPTAQYTPPQTIKERILFQISRFSIFPWTNVAHYLYNFAPILDYAQNVYLKRNRSINYWVSQQYQRMLP